MTELVALIQMDMSHVLKAESAVDQLTDQQLQAANSSTKKVEDIREQLQQGLLFYCTDSPSCPYVMYASNQHYLNTLINDQSLPAAKLIQRFAFLNLDSSSDEMRTQMVNGAVERQYENDNNGAFAPYVYEFQGNDIGDAPIIYDHWIDLLFYSTGRNGEHNTVPDLPYQLTKGTKEDEEVLFDGALADDSCLYWDKLNHEGIGHTIHYGEPDEEGTYPFVDFALFGQKTELEVPFELYGHWVLDDDQALPLPKQAYQIELFEPDDQLTLLKSGETDEKGQTVILENTQGNRYQLAPIWDDVYVNHNSIKNKARKT